MTKGGRAPVASMPGVFRLSIPALVDAAGEAAALGIPTIAVFPAVDPALKDPEGSEALNPDNLVCRAVAALEAGGARARRVVRRGARPVHLARP